mmetsp:Transcript_44956/g.82127  ORF Transcript_44956/g.82127 Transcript_44956/m.82127 type:complete len:151 (-) Transcript_44956:13-465(-)
MRGIFSEVLNSTILQDWKTCDPLQHSAGWSWFTGETGHSGEALMVLSAPRSRRGRATAFLMPENEEAPLPGCAAGGGRPSCAGSPGKLCPRCEETAHQQPSVEEVSQEELSMAGTKDPQVLNTSMPPRKRPVSADKSGDAFGRAGYWEIG